MRKIKKLFSKIGPGFITGASDDDPSGIATYSQTGAQFGYSQLWTALFSFPFMAVVQEMCGRIGLTTGKGLAGVIRKHYPKSLLYFSVFLLLIANTINIGADLQAMASSAQLVFGFHYLIWLVIITTFTVILQIFIPYRIYANILKYLTFSLFAYVITVFIVKQEWSKIAFSIFVPSISFDKDYLLNIVAILGTTISPYLFFWQAGEEVEDEVAMHKLRMMGAGIPRITIRDIKVMRIDTIIGMFFSNLIMLFIIITSASTLGRHGIHSIETSTQAAEALKPIAGQYAFLLFAIGIIGTGLLALPVLSGAASYALSETFGWKEGLYRKFKEAYRFYGIILIATIVGLLVNFLNIKPFTLLYYTAILNGICAPVFLVMIMLISNNEKIMGKYTNSMISNIIGWSITIIMFICSIILIISFFV